MTLNLNIFFENLQLPKNGSCFNIRNLEERDLDDLYLLESDPEVKKFMGGPVSEFCENWGAKVLQRGHLAVEMNDEASFAGLVTIGHHTKTGWLSDTHMELHVMIAKPFQRRGIGKEVGEILIRAAVFELGAEYMYAVIDPRNEASLKLFKSLGFKLASRIDQPDSWQHQHCVYMLTPDGVEAP